MSEQSWVLIVVVVIVLAVALYGGFVTWKRDRAAQALHEERMKDPQYRQDWHDIHQYDDWEDQGYFDGR